MASEGPDMALANQKTDWPVNAAGTPMALPRDTQAPASPARALQQLLDQRTSQVEDVERWSRRRQIAFIVVSASALWAAILELATQAVRAIA